MDAIRRIAVTFITVAFMCIFASWIAYGYLAWKGIQKIEDECHGSIAYCMGQMQKEYEDGLKDVSDGQ